MQHIYTQINTFIKKITQLNSEICWIININMPFGGYSIGLSWCSKTQVNAVSFILFFCKTFSRDNLQFLLYLHEFRANILIRTIRMFCFGLSFWLFFFHYKVSELHGVSYLIWSTIRKEKVSPEAPSKDTKEVRERSAKKICPQFHVIKYKGIIITKAVIHWILYLWQC